MADEVMAVSQAYSYTLLRDWEEIMALSKRVRLYHVYGYRDLEILSEYIGNMMQMWLELVKDIEGREADTEFGPEFIAEFKYFEKYNHEEYKMIEKDNEEDIKKLEIMLRAALKKLGILRFEG